MGVKSVKVPVGVALVLLLPFMVQCRHEAPRAPESDAARLLAPAPQQQPAPQAEPKWAAPEELCRAALQSSLRASKGLLPRGLAAVRTSMRAARYQEAVDILRFSLDSYEGAEADDARYLLGKLMSQAGEPGAAGYLSSLPQPFLPVEEERLYWLAKALLNEGEEDAALLAMDELNRRSKGSEAELESRLWKAALLWGRGDAEKARQLAAEVSKAQTHRGLKAQALRALVEYNRETATKTAAGLERDLLLRYPMEKATREPALSLGVEELSDGERFERAKTLIRHWGYAEAREELRRLSSHSKYGDDARWEVARIGISSLRDNVEEALEIYMDFASRAGPRQEEASFLVGRALGRLYRHAEALEALEGYLKRYRKGQFRERASYLLAWIAYDAKDCTVAEPRLQDWLSKHNDTVERGYYAWCKIRTGQWEEALTAFERLVPPGNPLVRGKARYWQAYALDQLGRRDEAREKLALLHSGYPLTYYDILGYQMEAQWDGRDARASQLPIFEGAGKASLEWQADSGWSLPKLSGSTAKTWSKVRRLVELDELERARKLYEPIRQSVEKSVAQSERDSFLLFVGDRLEDYHSAFKLASGGVSAMSSKQPDATSLRWQMAYPRAYAPLVSSLARAYDVPEYLVYGIMLQESRFRSYQVSSADAVGALQMIPSTAEMVAAELDIEYDARRFPEPRVGFQYSIFYMSKHLLLFENITFAAASYNGGPHRVGPWVMREKGKSMPFVVEEFAYDESRHYCRKVAEHMLRYLYLYEADVQRRGEILDALFPVEVNFDIPEDVGY